jgi:hypothetical protein
VKSPSCHPERASVFVIPSGGGAKRRRSRGIPQIQRLSRAQHSPGKSGDPSTRPSGGLAQDDRRAPCTGGARC